MKNNKIWTLFDKKIIQPKMYSTELTQDVRKYLGPQSEYYS